MAARPGDECFETVTARRPVIEAAVAAVAARTPGVTFRRGVRVSGLLTRPDGTGVPHVTGVLTNGGTAVRRGPGRRRLGPPVRRSRACSRRPARAARPRSGRRRGSSTTGGTSAPATVGDRRRPGCCCQHFHGFSVLTLPADDDIWGVGLVTSSRDQAVRGLRDQVAWNRAAALLPELATWCDGRADHRHPGDRRHRGLLPALRRGR